MNICKKYETKNVKQKNTKIEYFNPIMRFLKFIIFGLLYL